MPLIGASRLHASRIPTLLVASSIVLPAAGAAADLAVGLRDEPGIVMQLYSLAGSRLCWILNDNDEPKTVDVRRLHPNGMIDGIPLAAWHLEPRSVSRIDLASLRDELYLAWSIDGGDWGVTNVCPERPAALPGGIVTTANADGGCGDWPLWFEQEKLGFQPGEVAAWTLVVSSRCGVVFLERSRDEANWMDLTPIDVRCATLPVQRTRSGYEIDTEHPIVDRGHHTITLTFEIPQGTARSVAAIAARVRSGSRGGWVTRWVWIEPSEKRIAPGLCQPLEERGALALQRYDAVFAGRVTAMELLEDSPQARVVRPSRALATMRVLRSWKGVEDSTASIVVYPDYDRLGFDVRVGGYYLVFAHQHHETLQMSSYAPGSDSRELGPPARVFR